MILKGSTISSIGHARKMAAHLFKEENETVIVRETIGGSQDCKGLEDDLVDMQLYTRITRGNRGIFSVAINPRQLETLTERQRDRAVEVIEKELGLVGQIRLQVDHVKDGRAHTHVFWSIVDQQRGKLIDLPHYKRRLQSCAKEMEKEFSHEHTRREANENTITITNADRMRKARTGKDPKARKQRISTIWNQSITAFEFIDTLRSAGYQVVQGTRCRYAIIDRDGEVYNLVRQLPKLVKQKQVHELLGEQYDNLLTVEQAREQQKVRSAELTAHQEQKLKRQMEKIQKRRTRERDRDE